MLPLILRMALPTIAAQLVNLLYGIVDRIFIGHIPEVGNNALAGIGITSSIIILISAFSSIISGGGAPLASIALGKGDRERASKILGNGFVLLLLFTVITSVPAYIFLKPILLAVGASESTLPYAADYLSVYLAGTIFVQLSTGLNTFISVQGRPAIAMGSVLVGAVLNTCLDPLFIFTFGMGVKGAALATVIAQGFSAAWVISFLFSRRASLPIRKKYVKPDIKIILSVLSLGISPFVMASTESLVGFVLNGSLKEYGDIYVSALTVMQSAMMLVTVPLTGFSQGFAPVISYNYGHGSKERVKLGFKIVLPIMVAFNAAGILLIVLFPQVIARMFTDQPNLIEVVSRMMPLFLSGMSFMGLQRTCQNMFMALGQAKISLFIALLRKVILLVPLALILPRFFEVEGVYLAESFADVTAATCCTIIFFIRFPKILEKIDCPENKLKA